MKKKIGTLIEDNLLRQVKHISVEEGKTLSTLFNEALREYLKNKTPNLQNSLEAFQFFCENPLDVRGEDLKEIIDEDVLQP